MNKKKFEVWCAKTVEDINIANYERPGPMSLDEALAKAREYLLKGYTEVHIHPF